MFIRKTLQPLPSLYSNQFNFVASIRTFLKLQLSHFPIEFIRDKSTSITNLEMLIKSKMCHKLNGGYVMYPIFQYSPNI